MFSIEVKDSEVRNALQALANKARDLSPVLDTIGEVVMERSKQRFATSTGPDGQRWQGNSVVTLQRLIARTRGKKGSVLKNGNLSKKSQTSLAGKKVLIDSGSLADQFGVARSARSVTIGNTMIYAAIHQFGGKRSQFPNLWGDIPARPFLPITQDGQLYPAEETVILQAINDYLAGR